MGKFDRPAGWHIKQQLDWFASAGIDRWDLAVRRPSGAWIGRQSADRDRAALERCLQWARYENAQELSDVYLRPARWSVTNGRPGAGYDWPMAFWDDVPAWVAAGIVARWRAMVVETSGERCHLWLVTSRPLSELERCAVQREHVARFEADAQSTSGEHWGRAAGFRNWKREGVWVGVRRTSRDGQTLDVPGLLPDCERKPHVRIAQEATGRAVAGRDASQSGQDWGWTCQRLEAGLEPSQVEIDLAVRAAGRGKRSPSEYAARTVRNACQRLGLAYR